MTVLVVGAGSTGGYFGMRLAQAGRDVTFLVRPRRAEVLRRRGLRLTGVDGEARIEPRLVLADGLEREYDIVLLSVKATALEPALDDLSPAVGPGTRIVPFLNGMGHLAVLNARFGKAAVLTGVVKIISRLDAEGDIVKLAPIASLEIAQQDSSRSPRLDEVVAELSCPGCELSVPRDGITAMWRKWVFIATLGALTCLMRGSVGEIAGRPGGAELAPAILAEAAAISAAAGHPVPGGELAAVTAMLTQRRSALTSSLYRDLHDGAATEVEAILGDLVSEARRRGVPTPLLDLATLQVRVYEHRRANPSMANSSEIVTGALRNG